MSNASLGNFILIGKTSKTFSDKQYIGFETKDGLLKIIPKVFLSKLEINLLPKKDIIIYKEIDPQTYIKEKKICHEYLIKSYKMNQAEVKKKCF